ncbi:hypothetical protein [Aeromicrobium sp. HA]|uniref:hypothetical protein n=1 Tax=Aeromicrobium sp. HA TaxID=3009077 RepID=UPI0022AF07F3|nr:hypothetical protein [Aeromicrobium sp. HA]
MGNKRRSKRLRRELAAEVGLFGGMGLQKCKRIKRNGERCKNAPMKGQTVCHKHGGKAPQNLRKAAERIAAASPGAASRVEFLSKNAKSEHVKLQANQDILDRAGIGKKEPAVDVTINHARWIGTLDEIFVDFNDEEVDVPKPPTEDRPATPDAAAPSLPAHDPHPPRYGTD